jgi:hypothetical protein
MTSTLLDTAIAAETAAIAAPAADAAAATVLSLTPVAPVTPATPAAAAAPAKTGTLKLKAVADKSAHAAKPATEAATADPKTPPTEKGKLFRWNGKAYEEVVFEENNDRRVPMVEEAFQAAVEIRKQVQARVRMRPDISIVASALVLAAAKMPDVVDEVARYGLEAYARAAQKPAA